MVLSTKKRFLQLDRALAQAMYSAESRMWANITLAFNQANVLQLQCYDTVTSSRPAALACTYTLLNMRLFKLPTRVLSHRFHGAQFNVYGKMLK